MPALAAYRASLRPHRHQWRPLTAGHERCWCGATRPTPPADQ